MPSLSKKDNKPTVIAVGLFIPGNSFTRVFETLFKELSRYYTIHWLGIAYKQEKRELGNYTLHPCNVKGGDMYGAYEAADLAKKYAATCILLINDFYLLKNYERGWSTLKKEGIKLVAYVPLDGEITDISIIRDCLFLDRLVLYNRWAMDQVNNAFKIYAGQNGLEANNLPALSFRYHGVDTGLFQKHPDKESPKLLKKELFSIHDAAESIFLLNANRYNERKNIEATIGVFDRAYPLFGRPVYLCLHTPNIKPQLKEQLEKYIAGSSYKHRILLNPLGEDYIDDVKLVKLYRACAIGINTSFGEGWGMISFEHAACGAAQIVPGHTAQEELWHDAGVIIKKEAGVKLDTNPFQMYEINRDDAVAQLIELVNDDVFLEYTSAQCFNHANSAAFRWDKIAEMWKELL